MPQVLQGVELLTLSACDTAIGGENGDGKKVEGFAVLALAPQGAKAVMATLWEVADERYGVADEGILPATHVRCGHHQAEALRQAQLALLTGKLGGERVLRARDPGRAGLDRCFTTFQHRPAATVRPSLFLGAFSADGKLEVIRRAAAY